MKKLINLTGRRFGRLTVGKYNRQSKKWLCECDCGNFKGISAGHLNDGHARSCGCLNSEILKNRNYKHGLYGTRAYKIYAGILQRCLNKNDPAFLDYGGRGISICNEWLNDFMSFYNWAMSHGYSDSLSIDRKNVNGNYEPDNCRWATQKMQCNNLRRNIMFNGHTLKEECERFGYGYHMIYARIRRGWTMTL